MIAEIIRTLLLAITGAVLMLASSFIAMDYSHSPDAIALAAGLLVAGSIFSVCAIAKVASGGVGSQEDRL